jgi:hypothetical protein
MSPTKYYIALLTLLLVLVGCAKAGAPRNEHESQMIRAAIAEAERKQVQLPRRCSYKVYDDLLIREMKPTIPVCVVEIYARGQKQSPLLTVHLNPTNGNVIAFSSNLSK